MTFEQAKDQVAKAKYHSNYRDFEEVYYDDYDAVHNLLKEAAELYAKSYGESKWDEACEAQRKNCSDASRIFKFAGPEIIMNAPKPKFKP